MSPLAGRPEDRDHIAMSTAAAASLPDTVRHDALLYSDDETYVVGVGNFIRDGLQAGEPVFVAVPAANRSALEDDLGTAAEAVRFADMTMLGRNPARILPAINSFIDEHGHGPFRFVGEPIWSGRSAPEIAEATRHESLINLAFAGCTGAVLCPYDMTNLDAAVLDDAARTHRQILDGDGPRWSDEYVDPTAFCEAASWPLTPAPVDAEIRAFTGGQLADMRKLVRRRATEWGLPTNRIADLVVAVNELTTNTLLHTRSPGVLQMWRQPGELICEVLDTGRIVDPLIGRHVPDPRSSQHRGLWLVNQLCDLVELRSSSVGTTVRVHMSL